jgi:hypothetical protein
MVKPIAILGLAAAVSLAAVADASAWTRGGSVSGPRGGTAWRGGGCSGGACSWGRGAVGPYGRGWSRSGSASCAGGTCNVAGQGAGPRGGYSYSRTVSR